MSSSTKSKPASASSPATGGETDNDKSDVKPAKGEKPSKSADKPDKSDVKAAKGEKASKSSDKSDKSDVGKPEKSDRAKSKNDSSSGRRDVVEIELEHSRQREIAWTICGILGGLLLVAKLGTVGVWGGYALIAYGLYKAYLLVMSFINPPGTIVVTDGKVVLPRGLHRGNPLEVPPSKVTAVYFLRRSVPWNRSSPVLVIELGEKAMIFPRDWFASEADQRHIVHALLTHLRPASPAAAAE
jgi:hypothetical protein